MFPVWMMQQKLKNKQSLTYVFFKMTPNCSTEHSTKNSVALLFKKHGVVNWFGVQAGHQTSSWSLNKHWAVYINICCTGKELYSLPASLPHFHLLSVAFAPSVRKKMLYLISGASKWTEQEEPVPHLSSDYFWLPWPDVFLHEHSVFTLMSCRNMYMFK